MAQQYLDLSGLQHYHGKLKTVAAGSIAIEGLTISLKSMSGATLGSVQIPETRFEEASANAAGLMSAANFVKLSGIAEGATKVEKSVTNGNVKVNGVETVVFTPAAHDAHVEGLYKITVDALGAVTGAVAVTKDDIVALGLPAQDTTYVKATAQADGLMSKEHFSKLEGIAAGAQVNVIESVKVNGEAVAVSDKAVNIDLSAYAKTAALADYATKASLDAYAKKEDLTTVMNYKGSVANFEALPAENLTVGDVYNVEAAHGEYAAGTNYAWDGKKWDALGGTFVIDSIANGDIDALFA